VWRGLAVCCESVKKLVPAAMALSDMARSKGASTMQHQKPQASTSVMARRYVARGRCVDMALKDGSNALFKDNLLMALMRNDVRNVIVSTAVRVLHIPQGQ
jgi:hypothetical protein